MSFSPKAKLLYRYIQGFIGLRQADVILASYPKSGNTWVRFFLCHLISLNEWQGRTVDFNILDRTMPELGVSNLMKKWEPNTIPRVVKTHRPFWPVFNRNKCILLVRDPRAVMASYYRYEMSRNNKRFEGTFPAFIRSNKFGIEAWARHYNSWKEQAGLILCYEDLRQDDQREFRKIVDFLGLDIEENIFLKAVEKSRLSNIKKVETTYGLSKSDEFADDFNFAGKGETGSGENKFSKPDRKYLRAVMEEYGIEYKEIKL